MIFDERGPISIEEVKRIREPVYINGHYRALIIIEELYGKVPIFICSPGLWRTATLSSALRIMEANCIPPIFGGFRPITERDIKLLQIQADLEFHRIQGANLSEVSLSSQVLDWARREILIPELTLLKHVKESELLKVMAYIVDPRWFCNRGIKVGSLEAFFGLTPRRRKDRWTLPRYHLLTRTWKEDLFIDLIKYVNMDMKSFLEQPQYVLYWQWSKAYYGRGLGVNDTYADVKANRLFLTCLFYLWLNRLEEGIEFDPKRILPQHMAGEFAKWQSELH